MSLNKPVRRIAIVGTGVIGASWAAQYLARGFDVVATDPAPNAEANLRQYVADAWKVLTKIGLSADASQDRRGHRCRSPEDRPSFELRLRIKMGKRRSKRNLCAT